MAFSASLVLSFGNRCDGGNGTRGLGFKAREKLHDAGFGPEARVSRVARKESAVAPMFRCDHMDVCVIGDRRIGKTRERNEWVILRGHYQSGHADLARDAQGAGPRVVIVGIAETAV